MPKPRPVINAFTASEVASVTGLSRHMTNYLAREGYLTPTYGKGGVRGKVRYYSYRDLVVARIVQRLCAAGIELKRLKAGIRTLSTSGPWLRSGRARGLQVIATDGHSLFYPDAGGSLIDLTRGGQHAFAFVLDVASVERHIKQQLTGRQLELFELKNRALQFEPRQPVRSKLR